MYVGAECFVVCPVLLLLVTQSGSRSKVDLHVSDVYAHFSALLCMLSRGGRGGGDRWADVWQ